jgi:hypothetical protein
MKTLEDLTPEIRAKIDEYKKRCVADLYSGVEHENFNRRQSIEYIEKIYDIAKLKKPIVFFAEDPNDYAKKFRQIHAQVNLDAIVKAYEAKNENGEFPDLENDIKLSDESAPDVEVKSHYLFLCSSYHRVYLMWYKFIQDEFKIDHKNVDTLNYLYENANNNIARAYFTQSFVLVLRMPKYIRRNNVGFHSVDHPAIEWPNYGMYYINGRRIPQDIFTAVLNKTYTFSEFNSLTDEDIKAIIVSMIIEKHGNDYLKEFLNASVVDEQVIEHSSGYTEMVKLWKTNEVYPFLCDINDNPNQPYAWIELICPSSGAVYLIDTSAHFTNALDACKFHRPNSIPMELSYNFNEFNN